ncbi:hypothetical protein XFF7767_900065 [Xanthomonas citri pv. fuscans]|nr:hypothetical protein XFF7767_900065 [Xanthomonas citri pv. fuscans]SOO12954.1 hypothetical protein XFF7766_1150030 [Xanthomonas citri pv. fuscans]SOO43190.1 hypothetical protein XFF1815_330026 [Xanthomonas citri pv. fuscans]
MIFKNLRKLTAHILYIMSKLLVLP